MKEMLKNPKPYYSGFLSDLYLLDDIESERKFGYTIPIFDGESKITGSRTMLAGDAAALVDPFLAEGIYYAVRSGQIAAEVASGVLHGNTTTASYQERIAQEIYPEFQYAQKIGMVFYTFPKLGYELLKRYPEFHELIFDPDNSFDVVTSTWALETLKEPKKTVAEFLRVINEDGYVIYAFHSLPTDITGRLYSYLMKRPLKKQFELRFLTPKERPFHKCVRSSIASFAGGLATVVILRKCCNVTDETAPCLIGEEEIPDSYTH